MRLMEPLAFDHEAVELSALKRWANFPTQHRFTDYSNSLIDSAHYTVSPFPCQPTLNNKIAIW